MSKRTVASISGKSEGEALSTGELVASALLTSPVIYVQLRGPQPMPQPMLPQLNPLPRMCIYFRHTVLLWRRSTS